MKPILFSTQMVQAILAGRKTQTRRVVTPELPDCRFDCLEVDPEVCYEGDTDKEKTETLCGLYAIFEAFDYVIDFPMRKARYQPGDILWVRETWLLNSPAGITKYFYKADAEDEVIGQAKAFGYRWRPSIHMPREAARIYLRVKGARIERVQDISADDAIEEGIIAPTKDIAVDLYAELWNSINAKRGYGYGWDANPWVWAYTFERICKEEAQG